MKLIGVDLAKDGHKTVIHSDLLGGISELVSEQDLQSQTKALIEISKTGAYCPYCGEALGKTDNVSNYICSVCGDVRGLPMECYTLQVKTRYTVQQIGARGKVWREPVNYVGKPSSPDSASKGACKFND